MLVYNKHLLFNMHGLNMKVKMENKYFRKFILCKRVIKESNTSNVRRYNFLSLEGLEDVTVSQCHSVTVS